MMPGNRGLWGRAKKTSHFSAGPFDRQLRCSLVQDPLPGYAPRSRLTGGQNFCAVKHEFIFARFLSSLQWVAVAMLVHAANGLPVWWQPGLAKKMDQKKQTQAKKGAAVRSLGHVRSMVDAVGDKGDNDFPMVMIGEKNDMGIGWGRRLHRENCE